MNRERMLGSLPIREGDVTIRALVRGDIDEYARWPRYPRLYEPFNETFSLRFAGMTAEQRDERFRRWSEDSARIALAADRGPERAVCNLMLRQIDWDSRSVGNMGFLVKPTQVEHGLGTRIMRTAVDWCFGQGIVSLRLDVVAANTRAVRCYEKAGFVRTGECWKDEELLRGVDTSLPEYDFLRSHLRIDGDVPQIRFWWMEIKTDDS